MRKFGLKYIGISALTKMWIVRVVWRGNKIELLSTRKELKR